jgi:hypothetical protein
MERNQRFSEHTYRSKTEAVKRKRKAQERVLQHSFDRNHYEQTLPEKITCKPQKEGHLQNPYGQFWYNKEKEKIASIDLNTINRGRTASGTSNFLFAIICQNVLFIIPTVPDNAAIII